MAYFPKNEKGITFSSKNYNPLGKRPEAPNPRLELSLKEHLKFLSSLDLCTLL